MRKYLAACCLGLIVGAVHAENHQITVEDFVFTPSDLTILVGDSVTWTNEEGFHNVVADDGSFRCANGCDSTGGNGDPASSSWSFTLTFNDPETIAYFCEVHGDVGGSGMSGTIEVIDDVIFVDGFEATARAR